MLKNDVLNAKAEELKTQLTEWASKTQVLAPGEILVFSLRIEQGMAVRRDEHDTAPKQLVPSPQMCAHRDFIAPARLTDGEIVDLLAQMPRQSRDALTALLNLNQNAPLQIWSKGETKYELSQDSINSKLRSYTVGGKYYWLVRESSGEPPTHEYWCQLWEVKKK